MMSEGGEEEAADETEIETKKNNKENCKSSGLQALQ